MSTYQSKQVSQKMPVASHGMASNVKCERFVVDVGANTSADRIEFGYLPDYAKPVNAHVISTGAVTLNIGDADVPARYFSAQAFAADTRVSMTNASGFRKAAAVGKSLIVGVPTANGAAGTIELTVFYVVEDTGAGYPA